MANKSAGNRQRKGITTAMAWIVLAVGAYYFLTTCQEFPFRGNPIAWLQARDTYAEAERFRLRYDDAKAVSTYKKAIEVYPYDIRFYLGISDSLSRLHEFKDAEKLLETASTFSNDFEIWINLAALQLAQQRFASAEESAARAAQMAPGSADATALLALALQLQGKTADATKVFSRAEKQKKDSARYWCLAGKYYAALNKKESAEGCFKNAVGLKPTNLEYVETLGYYYLSVGQIAEAKNCLRKALSLNNDSITAWASLGEIYLRQRDLADAEDAFQHAVKLAPTNVVFWRLLGQVQYQQSRYKQAAETFQKVLSLVPEDSTAADILITTLYRDAKFPELELVLRKSVSMPRQARFIRRWSLLGDVLQHQGKADEAADAYERALELAETTADRNLLRSKLSSLAKHRSSERKT